MVTFKRWWRTKFGLALGVLLAVAVIGGCAGQATPAATTAPPATKQAATAAATAVASPAKAPAATQAATKPATKVSGEVTVFAAASLTEAFGKIGAAFEAANPGAKVVFNFAGSSALRTQLSQGARADVFASADEVNMEKAIKDGSIAGDPKVFVRNRLVIITPAQQKVEVKEPKDLAKPGLKLVIAQKEVPVGNYSRQSFDKMEQDASFGSGFAAKVLANVVSEEANVKAVATKVQLGEADAGVVYSTDVTPAIRAQVKVIEIPEGFNLIARYPIAIVKGASNQAAAQAFIDYVFSPAGQAELKSHGFLSGIN